jgi:hypothetical protein
MHVDNNFQSKTILEKINEKLNEKETIWLFARGRDPYKSTSNK